MSSPHVSFQDFFFPLQQLTYFQAKLDQCQQMLTHLRNNVPNFVPDAAEYLTSAATLLQPLQNQLAVIEYQLWQIVQLQLHHHLQATGHLPPLDAD